LIARLGRDRRWPGARIACTLTVLCLLPSGAMAAPAPALEPGQQPAAGTRDVALDTVLVTGRRRQQIFDERLNTFVGSITIRQQDESLPRWQVPICPWVAGAAPEFNDYIRGRVWQVAKYAGAPLAASDCSPNLVVVLTPEPRQFLEGWWADEHRLFNQDQGVAPINRFIRSDEAVRVWYNSCPMSPVWAKTFGTGKLPPCYSGLLGSRLAWETVRAIYTVIVVVDSDRIEGLSIGQLADYIAVVGLANVRRDSELGQLPTILRLFAEQGPARPQGMSSWDKSFLESLYRSDVTSVTQLAQIKTRMTRALGGTGPDPRLAVVRLQAEINRITPGAGRLVSYAETGANYEGPEEMQSALVNFEAELEFTGDAYFRGERKAGAHVQVYGEVEYITEGGGWRVLRMAIYDR
jgi:hypothetical protein